MSYMRPLVFIGGYLTSPRDFTALVQALEAPPYSFRVFVTPIGRLRWAITRDWDFRPVLNRLRSTVRQALAETGAESITLVAYSVGGTAARIYLGDKPYLGELYAGNTHVHHLITLGTPHHSQERWTRTLVGYSNEIYPGAFYPHVRYTSVIGHALQGNRRGNSVERMAYQSYNLVSGEGAGEGWGDGVTTLQCAALSGAEYLPIVGLHHSPFQGHPWYADPEALPQWGHILRPVV
jgi:pimeloyl-ACP methyl ester carboxylesterase